MTGIRHPLLHFLAIGAVLFAAERVVDRAEPEIVEIPPSRVTSLGAEWLSLTGRAPNEIELAALVTAEADDEILYRAARARGYHRSDPLVRRRLARNMRFVADGAGDEGDLVREALELGMDRSDLVVRRRLIQKMRLLAEESARQSEPSDDELQRHLEGRSARFERPPRVRLSHLYFSNRRRRDPRGDAVAIRAAIASAGATAARSGEWGDPFLHGRELPLRSQVELAGAFGDRFAADVFALRPGAWSEAIASSYGAHLVFVHQREPARVPPLDAIRAEVRESLLAERGRTAVEGLLARLRSGYRVRAETLDGP